MKEAPLKPPSSFAQMRKPPEGAPATTLMPHHLYLPKGLGKQGTVPLIVALHGCQQSPADFAAGTRFNERAEALGAIVVYPEQSRSANAGGCWNWFKPQHQQRAFGEPAAILALVEHLARTYPVDRRRIFVTGLSAGASMAAILAEQAPDVFSRVGIAAGVALHASHDVVSAFAAMAGKAKNRHREKPAHAPAAAALPIPKPLVNALQPLVSKIGALLGDSHRAPSVAVTTHAAQKGPGGSAGTTAYARMRVTIWTGTNDTTVAPANANQLVAQFSDLLGLRAASAPHESRNGNATVARWYDGTGDVRLELWTIADMGHAWSGGSLRGSYTYPGGPDATDEMLRFFLAK